MCKHCGYCEHCGRGGGRYLWPYQHGTATYPTWPGYPYQPWITWSIGQTDCVTPNSTTTSSNSPVTYTA